MLNLIAKVYAVVLNVLLVIIILIGGLCGYFGAPSFIASIESAGLTFPLSLIVARIVLCIFGLVAAFLFDVVCFGYVAQVIKIKKNTEEIKKYLEQIQE